MHACCAGLYFTLPGNRERSKSLGRVLTYSASDANLAELGKVAAASDVAAEHEAENLRGKLSVPVKRCSNPTEFIS